MEFLPGQRAAISEDAAAFLDAGTRALRTEGDQLASRRWFDAAYRAAELSGDALIMAKAALGYGGLWVHEHRTAASAATLRTRLRCSLRLIDPDCPEALRIRVRLAAEADFREGRHTAVLALLDEVRASSDPETVAEALSLAHHCVRSPDQIELRRALAEELMGAAVQGTRRSDVLTGLLSMTTDAFLAGDPHAGRGLRELEDALAEGEHLAIRYVTDAIGVMLTIRAGKLAEAEQLARQCLEQGRKAGHSDASAWFGAQLAAIRWYQGRITELLPMLTEYVDMPGLSAADDSPLAALALAAATTGERWTARRLLAELRGNDLSKSDTWLVTLYGVVETAHLLGDKDVSATAYDLLTPFADLPMVVGLGAACFGPVHHALGVASLTVGDVHRAVAHFRAAVDRSLAVGHWPAVLAAQQRLAQALLASGDDVAAERQRMLVEDLALTLGIEAPAERATCTRHDRGWRVVWRGRAVLVDDSVGMLHLAALTANPETEIAAIDLVTGLDPRIPATRTGQQVLDRTAIQRYRRRLVELRDEIDRLEADGESSRAARAERDWVLAELGAGTGLGGRPRDFTDEQERARLAVGKAIRRAIGQIERADEPLGAHLRATVHTGLRCWYRPSQATVRG